MNWNLETEFDRQTFSSLEDLIEEIVSRLEEFQDEYIPADKERLRFFISMEAD